MEALFLIFAISAVVAGFTGLILIIKGFVDKNDKKIYLGTIVICVVLVIAVIGTFFIGKRVVNYKRYFENNPVVKMTDECNKGIKNVGIYNFINYCQGEMSAKLDSNKFEMNMKVVFDKKEYNKKEYNKINKK